jgi:hypothetical protein
MINNDSPRSEFLHILQKTGILKNFTLVKTITIQEVDKIKKEAKKEAKSPEEVNKLFQEKMAKIGNMTDPSNTIPGVVYSGPTDKRQEELAKSSEKWANKLKELKLSREELTFLISCIIGKLELTQEDFENLANENGDDDEYRDSE